MIVLDGQERDAPDLPAEMRGEGGEVSGEPAWPSRAALVWLPFVLAALFYAPLLFGLRTFPHGDFTDHFLPFSLFQRSALAVGQLPIWNPYTYSGHPFLADVQAAVFYPISNLILAATLPMKEPAARLYLLQLEAVLHLALAGLFTALLVEALTRSRAAALVAGVSFAFSGYLTGYPPLQLAVLRTAVWLPAILWCVLAAWTARRGLLWWSGAGVALAVAFLAGHPQTYLLTLYALAGWLALLVALGWRERSQVARGVAGALWMVVVAVGLSAAQWLPSLEFLRLSVRADVSYAFVSGGFPLQDSWQLLLPGVLTTYSPLYIGVGGLQLALCALIWAGFAARRSVPDMTQVPLPWRAGVAFFGGMALLALLASYGGNGPLYPLLYRFAPGWSLFRGQERAAYLVALGLCVLAGYGVALTSRVSDAWRRRGALWSAALTLAGVYAFGLLWQMAGRTAVGNVDYLLIAARTLLVGAGVALMVWLPGWPRRKTQLLAVLITGTLFVANAGTNLDAGTPVEKTQVAPEVSAVQQALAESRTDDGLRGRVYNEFRVYDDYGMRAGVEDVWGSSPLRLARYARLFEGFPLDRMWRLLGVEHVLTWRRELFGPTELLAEFPQAEDTTYLHRLPDAHPRAWWVDAVQVVDDETAWQMLADHQVDLERIALLAEPTEEITAAANSAAVRVTRLAHSRLHVEAVRAAPGFLVVAENWMPGWRVLNVRCAAPAACAPGNSSGGLLQPVRANLTLVGIALPAGEVAFDLVYAPTSVRLGLWISGVTLLLLAATVGGISLRHRRQGA